MGSKSTKRNNSNKGSNQSVSSRTGNTARAGAGRAQTANGKRGDAMLDAGGGGGSMYAVQIESLETFQQKL
ncbi:hypothetical protein, partial [Actinocrinis sp.]|uniref:hypothetical protein n=1 Tax=Actinocrinis sp. TaxID=1920516 RepID=UPI002D52D63F